nr:MAG TPA: hypothetical protein [Caudoviricetes sp.]DAM33192.1 MAG TPA: hypothetical protein [Caudoviricetes sp.]
MTAERKCSIIIHNSQSVIYLHFGFFIWNNFCKKHLITCK